MKRLLVFLALGPLLGHIVGHLVVRPLIFGMPIDVLTAAVTLPIAYLVGFFPALITGGVDYEVKERRRSRAWTVLVGIFFAVPVVLFLAQPDRPFIFLPALLMGGVPAAVCSWLTSDKKPKSKAPTMPEPRSEPIRKYLGEVENKNGRQ